MSRVGLALALGLSLCGASFVAANQGTFQQTTGAPTRVATGTASIAGVVVGGDGSVPIRRAEVTVTPVGGASIRPPAVTDDEGRFLVAGLAPGRYLVAASKGGYVRRAYGATRPNRPGTAISVADGERVSNVSVGLVRGGAIEGTIRDENGFPAVGVPVRLLQLQSRTTGEAVLRPADGAMAFDETDDRGTYRLYGIAAGEYVVSASPRLGSDVRAITDADFRRVPEGRTSARTATATGGRGQAVNPPEAPAMVGYSPVYFPGTTNATSATAVRVGAGEERTGIDFGLELIRMARVQGTLAVPAGVSPQSVQLLLLTKDAFASGTAPVRAAVDADERFTFSGIAPGRYTLTARTGGMGMMMFRSGDDTVGSASGGTSGGMYSFSAATPMAVPAAAPGTDPLPVYWASLDVSVQGRDQRDLVVSLQPALTLTGRIAAAAGTALPADLSTVRVWLSPVSTDGPVQTLPPVIADNSGGFRLSGVVPGRYRLTAAVSPGPGPAKWSVLAATIGGRDAIDTPLELTGTDSGETGLIILTTMTQSVTGRLEDASGRPAPEYTILVFPDEPRLWAAGARRVQTTRPATDGSFVIADLPAGAYRIAALTDIDPSETSDASFLQSIHDVSVAFTLMPGERKVQDFRLGR